MILIAGGIGSGKSVISRIMRLRGYGVFDCDYEARVLMNTDCSLKSGICNIFGDHAYLPSGELDRRLISREIFADAEKRRRLNRLVHAPVLRRITDWKEESKDHIFIESAIGAESGIVDVVREIWLATAPELVRIQRVMTRSGLPEAETRRIMEAQKDEEKRLYSCGKTVKIIDNSPSVSLLEGIPDVRMKLESK